MDRRQALKLTAGMFAGTIIGSELFLSCISESKNEGFITAQEVDLLDEVGETILPKTDRSPGAKEARIGLFMKTMVEDCYSEVEQQVFKEGISSLNELADSRFSKSFTQLSKQEKHDLLVDLDKEVGVKTEMKDPHYFTMMKQLTLWGYFTSQPGATKALRYNPIPGGYKGCVPIEEGAKAWA